MKLIFRVGNKYDPFHPNFIKGCRDGQLIDIRPDDYQEGRMERKHFLVLQTPHDYWALRGATDWKSDKAKVLEFKKFLVPADRNGKYPWEFGYLRGEKRVRWRDWFVDIEKLLQDKWITQANHDGIRDFSREYGSIPIDRPLTDFLVHEDVKTRIDPTIHNMAIASGTFSIGAALDYATVTAFEADIAAALTGNLTGEHADEETAITSLITFDTDTATFLLKLTAASGAEHDGTAYGNGARINFGTSDGINFNETTGGDLDDIEMSNLATDNSGNQNSGISLEDGGDSGTMTLNRILMQSNSVSVGAIRTGSGCETGSIRNCISYGFTKTTADFHGGIHIDAFAAGTYTIYNNTCIKNYNNIYLRRGNSTNLTIKNNLAQGDTGGADYTDADTIGWGTTAKNISEDATSPDASYQSKDLHTNTIFNDYANDDYTLDPAGDATNLAIADDGDDLSGIFTDDIIGQTRSTWYIGASEIVAAGGLLIPVAMHHHRQIQGVR